MKYKSINFAAIVSFIFSVTLLAMSFSYVRQVSVENDKNYELLEKAYKLELVYKEIANILSKELTYINYDVVNGQIDKASTLIAEIGRDGKFQPKISVEIEKVKADFDRKSSGLERFKSINAVAANSLLYLGSSEWGMQNRENFVLFSKLISVNVDKEIDLFRLKDEIESKTATTKQDEILKAHALSIVKSSMQMRVLAKQFDEGGMRDIKNLKQTMSDIFKVERERNWRTKNILFIVTFLALSVLFFLFILFWKNKIKLNKFHAAITKSDGFIVMADKEHKITYANEVATSVMSSGAAEDILGKDALSFFADGSQKKEKIDEKLGSNEVYRGELECACDGKILNIKIAVLGIYVDNKLDSVLYLGMDVTKEKRLEERLKKINRDLSKTIEQKVREIQEKDAALLQGARQVAMGEAISNIAHHWRQPLNALGIIIQDIKLASDFEELTKEHLEESVLKSKEILKQMSKTIENFRMLFKPTGNKERFTPAFAVQKAMLLAENVLKNSCVDIRVDESGDTKEIFGYSGDLAQCILNALINSKEILEERNIPDPYIDIKIQNGDSDVIVVIVDNGGGVKDGSADRIFEPYFTTKPTAHGSGLGLFMIKNIVEKNMGGVVEARNTDEGLSLKITLPVVGGFENGK